jgi:hypothetical protein
LFDTALGAIFLTHRQLAVYRANGAYRCRSEEVVGCSLLDAAFFERVQRARKAVGERAGTAIVYSGNVMKGTARAQAYCEKAGIEAQVIRGLQPDEVLDVLERCAQLVYLPIGLEPAGRVPVEGRFLGCNVVTNAHTGVTGESWWGLPDALALQVLRDAPHRFWRLAARMYARREHLRPFTCSRASVARLPVDYLAGLLKMPVLVHRARMQTAMLSFSERDPSWSVPVEV